MKFLLKVFTCLFALLAVPLMLFAQASGAVEVSTTNYVGVFATFGSLVVVIPVITEFVKRGLRLDSSTPDWIKQLLSWLVGIVVTLFGWYFSLGFLAGIPFLHALIWGFGVSLASNGVADIKIIQWIFNLFTNAKNRR